MQVSARWFEDYEIGEERRTQGRTITEADIVLHAGQTGDFFPHHMDAEWSAESPAGQRVAHGTLVMSVAVGMTSSDINPRSMSYGYDRVRFIRPVYIGDTLTVTAQVVGKREYPKKPSLLGFLDEQVTVTNQRGETVMALTHIYVIERSVQFSDPLPATTTLTDEKDPPQLDASVTSAQISDSLDSLGVRGQVLDGRIRPLRPGSRIAGRARTIRFEPVTRPIDEVYGEPDPYRAFLEFMAGVVKGEVIVVATGGDERTAYWGELFSAAAFGQGAVGLVCDSFTRDRAKVEALGFPVFSLGTRPLDYRGRMQIAAVQEPVVCAGVRVSPGDLVLAEDDGVVVVPDAVRDETLRLANERSATESTVLRQLLDGRSLSEVWDEHRVL